jgi:hypothetical protein
LWEDLIWKRYKSNGEYSATTVCSRSVNGLSIQSLTHFFLAAIDDFDYAFAENGLTAYKLGNQLSSQSYIKFLGEERHKKLVNFILHYLADLDIPIKR